MSRNQPAAEESPVPSPVKLSAAQSLNESVQDEEIQFTRAVPFIQHIDGKFVVCDEGARLLSAIKGPVSVIAVAGLYRTGKSFLLNNLVKNKQQPKQTKSGVEQKATGFEVGDTTRSCTRGINVWVPPDHSMQPHGSTLVLMDTEGMASMDQDETYDALIFSLGLLLSSTFVLNSMGVIDEAAIDRLFLVSELTKHVCVNTTGVSEDGNTKGLNDEQEQDEAEREVSSPSQHIYVLHRSLCFLPFLQLAGYFPPLLWLLRDFVVKMVDEDGKTQSSDEYLEHALQPRAGTRGECARGLFRLSP
jgi:hypothetical protein